MRKIILILVLLSTSIFGQAISLYSNFGVGELNVNPTARRSGFGLGIAALDNFDINPFNPASTSKIQFVKFAGSLNYSWNSFSDQATTNSFRTGAFDYLLLAIPVQRDYGIVLSGGISPLTKMNYKVLSPEFYFDSIPYKVKYEGLGGLTDYYFGLSYNIKSFGSIGLSANFLIGTVTDQVSTEFVQTSFINPVFKTESNYKGVGVRFGFISENLKTYIDNLPLKEFRIGFSYLSPVNLSLERTKLKQGIFLDTISQNSYKTKLPGQFAAGISAKLSDRSTLYVDYLNQDWSKLNTYSQSGFASVSQNYFSIGFEYVPVSRPEKYFEAITWRFGLFSKNIGLAVNDVKINEYGFKAGASLPVDQLNSIDIGVQYSIRGKKANNLVKESVLNIWFGINFAEIWFVRSEE